jgi:hypothetical protein
MSNRAIEEKLLKMHRRITVLEDTWHRFYMAFVRILACHECNGAGVNFGYSAPGGARYAECECRKLARADIHLLDNAWPPDESKKE